MPNVTTTTQSGVPDWLAPYYQNYLNGAFGVANRPYQQYQGPQVAGLSDLQTGALGGIQGAMYGNPTTWQGMGLLGNIMQNQGNPNLQNVTDTIASDAGRAFSTQLGQLNDIFSNPNSLGGARHQLGAEQLTQDFGRGLGQSLGNLQYGQYNTGLDRGMAAANQAQSMSNSQFSQLMQGLQAGSIPQQLQQRIYDQGQQNFNNWWQYPMQQSQFLGQALGMGGSRFNTNTTTNPGPSTGSQILGGSMLGLAGLGGTGAFGSNGWMTGNNGLFSNWFG